MIKLAKEASPELMRNVGPFCKVYGYCQEREQCEKYKGIIPKKQEALSIIKKYYNQDKSMTDNSIKGCDQ